MSTQAVDVVIIGGGAAGMMCGWEAASRGRSMLIIDHARRLGEKIRISGGGRCNFTNLDVRPENFISDNPHFMKSALKRFTPADFIARVEAAGIGWHEKTLGQLFCDDSASQIIDMLVAGVETNGGRFLLQASVTNIERQGEGFHLKLSNGESLKCSSLVVASGGKSIPKIGATGFGYQIAEKSGLAVTETRPALVPLTFDPDFKARLDGLAGVSCDAVVTSSRKEFCEALLITHRGLSGPAILQVSSYWREGESLKIALDERNCLEEHLRTARKERPKQALATVLGERIAKRLAARHLETMSQELGHQTAKGRALPATMADYSNSAIAEVVEHFCNWQVTPAGSEGYRTAEVTLGGVDTNGLDSKTMEAKAVPGLYFIGEVVDVTGWLGGYNFQWAWSSGWAAGQVV